jgi:hypothetical protein
LRATPVDRQFGAGREGRVEREEEDGLATLRSESGYLRYIMTTGRITSGELSKYRKGFFIVGRWPFKGRRAILG